MLKLLIVLGVIYVLAKVGSPSFWPGWNPPRHKSSSRDVGPLPWFDPNYKKRQEEKRRREGREFRGENRLLERL